MLIIFSLKLISTQCSYEPVLGTKVGNIKIERDDFELSNIVNSILQLLVIVKRETFHQVGNFVQTSNSSLCQFVGQGVNLQQLSDYNSTFTLPILTSARVIGNKILIQGNKRSTLVDSNLLATLLHAIDIENHVNLEKSAALVFIQIDGRKILTNFDKERDNLCHVEKDILGIQKTAIGILTQLNSIFDDAMSLNKLFHDPVDMERF
jgi:hypothetical protein